MASTRVWLLAAALAVACALLACSRPAGAEVEEGLPPAIGGTVFGCNPAVDKTCKPDGPKILPGGGVDLDGDGDEDELPMFDTHHTILGHSN